MADGTNFLHILSTDELCDFCEKSQGSEFIGFDTEFVSENRYQPELCLLQVATDSEIAIIDTVEVPDVTPFWELLTEGDHVTVAHAAREEFLFCFRAIGKKPKNLFDVQLAAGFVGMDYPAAYSGLVSQLLGEFVSKGETRTDWRRRPLSTKQINYAVQDVVFLRRLYDCLSKRLREMKRLDWYQQEANTWMKELQRTDTEPQWRRVGGITRLNRRGLARVKELWIFRDQTARKQNRLTKRVLPDDLIVEIAKRGSSDPSSFNAIRGFESRVSKKLVTGISKAVEKANNVNDADLPMRPRHSKTVNLGLLGQFLTTALNVVCRSQNIAPSLVGTASDTRALAAARLGLLKKEEAPPELSEGWRKQIVGQVIEDALQGKIAIRVGDPKSDHPLKIEQLE